jgi:L-lactate dehydrogenase complex protein LldG
MVENPAMRNGQPDSRERVLRRVREALRDVPEGEAMPAATDASVYLVEDTTPPPERIERFIERLAEYRAAVRRVRSDELPAAIAAACASRNARRIVVPADVPADWLPPELEPLRDPGLDDDRLDHSDGVLTGCALAIAQTGTVILDGGPFQGRRVLTLLPDYHLCVVREDQIVGTVPEAVRRIEAQRTSTRPLTWISGPSATSDIELNRVEGVHGPRTLEVLIVSEGTGPEAPPKVRGAPTPKP